jgi:hypothetical protein
MNKAQQLTSGIKHWGLSGYSSVLPRIKFGVTGQDSSPQSPTISYRHPLAFIVKTETDDRMTKEFLLHKDKRREPHRTVKHIWFLPTHKANFEKPKELALFQRTQAG